MNLTIDINENDKVIDVKVMGRLMPIQLPNLKKHLLLQQKKKMW